MVPPGAARTAPTTPGAGFVLCGGASRRMGRDKAVLEVDGRPMAARVAEALRSAGAATVAAVGGDGAALQAAGLEWLPDRWPGDGPLGGIVTALESGPAGPVVILSCDLLRPDPDAIRHLVEVRARQDADVVVPVVDGRHQWLHGCWHPRVRSILADVFAAGERSVAGAVIGLQLATTEGIDPGAVRDADVPADLGAEGSDG